jgi:hypothetical protein
VFLYVGAVGVANGLDLVVDAFARLDPAVDVRILVVGDGSARAGLEGRVAELGLDRVTLLGAVPRAEVRDFLAAADVRRMPSAKDPLLPRPCRREGARYLGADRPVTTVPGLRAGSPSGAAVASRPTPTRSSASSPGGPAGAPGRRRGSWAPPGSPVRPGVVVGGLESRCCSRSRITRSATPTRRHRRR